MKRAVVTLVLVVMAWLAGEATAQSQQPIMYIVGQYHSTEMREGYAIYWFESGDGECYVMVGYNHSGGGISCLRKSPS